MKPTREQIAERASDLARELRAQFTRWGPMAHVPRYSADGAVSLELTDEQIWLMAEAELQ